MPVLSDRWIRRMARDHGMIEPFVEAQKREGASIKHDISVPVAAIPDFLTKAVPAVLALMPGARPVSFGHLGDGNLHVNILREGISDHDWETKIPDGIGEIFKLTVGLGGTLSGEHGIGIAKRPYMSIAMSEVNLNLMRGIKRVFDPHGILNPGKIF